MKKDYIQPDIDVVQIDAESILAGSGPWNEPKDEEDVGVGDGYFDGEQLSKSHNNVWDDWD